MACTWGDASFNKLSCKRLQSADIQSGSCVTNIAHSAGGMGVEVCAAVGDISRNTCI